MRGKEKVPVWNEKVICRGCKEGDLEKGQKDPLEKGMAKPLQHSCLENPLNSMKRQKAKRCDTER